MKASPSDSSLVILTWYKNWRSIILPVLSRVTAPGSPCNQRPPEVSRFSIPSAGFQGWGTDIFQACIVCLLNPFISGYHQPPWFTISTMSTCLSCTASCLLDICLPDGLILTVPQHHAPCPMKTTPFRALSWTYAWLSISFTLTLSFNLALYHLLTHFTGFSVTIRVMLGLELGLGLTPVGSSPILNWKHSATWPHFRTRLLVWMVWSYIWMLHNDLEQQSNSDLENNKQWSLPQK